MPKYYYLISSFSNSSNDFPFVSGQFLNRNTKAQMQMALYIQNEPLLPKAAFIEGNENVSVQQPTHKANVHVAMAIPRTRLGNISANSVHVTGASVMAYVEIAATTSAQPDERPTTPLLDGIERDNRKDDVGNTRNDDVDEHAVDIEACAYKDFLRIVENDIRAAPLLEHCNDQSQQ